METDDLPRIVDFVARVRAGPPVRDYPSLHDLPQYLAREPNRTTARLFWDGDTLLALALVDFFSILRFEIDHDRNTPALESALLAWGRQCVDSSAGPQQPLLTTSQHADARRIAWLERNKFRRRPDSIVQLRRALAEPVTPIAVPHGFVIRTVRGEAEAAAVATLHRKVFGTEYMTTERRIAVMRSPTYRPAIDLVAQAPNGALAAYAMGTVDELENRLNGSHNAYADQFATHPDYRGRGLAHALMAEVLRRLQPGGYADALMSTDSTNAAMLRVARAAGFDATDNTLRFEQPALSTS